MTTSPRQRPCDKIAPEDIAEDDPLKDVRPEDRMLPVEQAPLPPRRPVLHGMDAIKAAREKKRTQK